ncbi:MAG: tRNA (guanosine(46)-N7)-methyltransferase TrmB [Culicoidibacterales bacterium]
MRLKKIPHATTFLQESGQVIYLNDKIKQLEEVQGQVELEIGCGKGDFILARAADFAAINYYAIEKFDSVLLRAVEKKIEGNLDNIQFISGDAAELLTLFSPGTLTRIFLNFSDPWPKKRHAKRRLTYQTKLEMYQSLLTNTGVLEFKSDNRTLYEFTVVELSEQGWIIQECSTNVHDQNSYVEAKKYTTEYEKRFIGKGQQIFYLKAIPPRK